jgi:hypothetical protein
MGPSVHLPSNSAAGRRRPAAVDRREKEADDKLSDISQTLLEGISESEESDEDGGRGDGQNTNYKTNRGPQDET